jgi:hypothetical protein
MVACSRTQLRTCLKTANAGEFGEFGGRRGGFGGPPGQGRGPVWFCLRGMGLKEEVIRYGCKSEEHP